MSTATTLVGAELAEFVRRLADASPLHAGLLGDHGATVERSPLPGALGDGSAYQVVIPVRRKPVELLVAEAGDDLVVLGSADRVHELARRRGVRIETADAAADYLRFWCRGALGHTEVVVEDATDFRWIPSVETDAAMRAHADEAGRLVRWIAVRSAPGGVHLAEATVLDQRTLELRKYRIGPDGDVAEVTRDVIATDVPVPYVLP